MTVDIVAWHCEYRHDVKSGPSTVVCEYPDGRYVVALVDHRALRLGAALTKAAIEEMVDP